MIIGTTQPPAVQRVFTTALSPTGTSSLTKVMMGLAQYITLQYYTRVRVTIFGDVQNGTASDGSQFTIYYGTGTAPTNGTAFTGTAVVSQNSVNPSAIVGGRVPFCIVGYVTGLTVGTTYWFDIGMNAVTGGTSTMRAVAVLLEEAP